MPTLFIQRTPPPADALPRGWRPGVAINSAVFGSTGKPPYFDDPNNTALSMLHSLLFFAKRNEIPYDFDGDILLNIEHGGLFCARKVDQSSLYTIDDVLRGIARALVACRTVFPEARLCLYGPIARGRQFDNNDREHADELQGSLIDIGIDETTRDLKPLHLPDAVCPVLYPRWTAAEFDEYQSWASEHTDAAKDIGGEIGATVLPITTTEIRNGKSAGHRKTLRERGSETVLSQIDAGVRGVGVKSGVSLWFGAFNDEAKWAVEQLSKGGA